MIKHRAFIKQPKLIFLTGVLLVLGLLMLPASSQAPRIADANLGGSAEPPPLPALPALPSAPPTTVPAAPPAPSPAPPEAPAASPAPPSVVPAPGTVQGATDSPELPLLPPGAAGAGAASGTVGPTEKAEIKQELVQLMGLADQLQKRIVALTQRLDGGSAQIMPPQPALPEAGGTVTGPDLVPPPGPPGATAGGAPGGAPSGTVGGEPKLAELKYPVSKFKITYATPNPKLPPIDLLEATKVLLGPGDEGLGTPRTGVAAKRNLHDPLYKLEGEKVYTGEGLQIIYTALAKEINRRGYYGVLVLPDPADIDATTGEDMRNGRKPLKIVIYTSTVKQVRTVSKQVKPGENAVDTAPLAWVIKSSPLQPGDLLKKPALTDYLTGLNRTPGQRVDAAINAAEEPGGIVLDYIVRKEKPFYAYLQASNTGTETTGDWRFRLGFEYRDLIGHDDALSGDFITSEDGQSISILGSYTRTLIEPAKLRMKVYGSYGKFQASDVGFDLQNFDGQTWTGGMAFTVNPFNIKGVPIDVFLGAEWRHVEVTNFTFPQSGESDFFTPYAGVSLAQATDRYSFSASGQIERNLPHVADTRMEDTDKLGRFKTTPEFTVAKWSVSATTYLEPLVFGAKWKEGKPWWKSTLAHEFAFSARGQYTFGHSRLVPQFEDVVGGLTTVRGYPEAITAGDSTVIGTAEYRIHLPKLLQPYDQDAKKSDTPPKFGLRPNTVGSAFGRADWDFIVRGFVDAGRTWNNERIASAESDEELLSTGVGLELQILRYMNFRMDYGIVLKSEKDFLVNPVNRGDGRFHFLLSFLW